MQSQTAAARDRTATVPHKRSRGGQQPSVVVVLAEDPSQRALLLNPADDD